MSLEVEDGSGVPGADSYLALEDFKTYASTQGYPLIDYADDQIETALRRATRWIDAAYRSRFVGVRTNGRNQALAWPRKAGSVVDGVVVQFGPLLTVTDTEGMVIADNVVPQELKDATAEAAWRELQSPGGLSPDLERGGAIRSLSAGSVSIEYVTTAPATTTFQKIDGILASLLAPAGNGYTGRAVEA